MRTIKLMADYDWWPLWGVDPGNIGNINPAKLSLSSDIQHRLARWASSFDATLDRNDPLRSGFATADDKAAFVDEGRPLSADLQSELGRDFRVLNKVF